MLFCTHDNDFTERVGFRQRLCFTKGPGGGAGHPTYRLRNPAARGHTCQRFRINRSCSGFQFFFKFKKQKNQTKSKISSRITLIAPFPINVFLISKGGPPDPLYSQIKLKNNSDCNICNLVLGKFPWVDPRRPGGPDPPSIGDRAKRGPSPLFRAHITNKCSGFRLFNVGRYAGP